MWRAIARYVFYRSCDGKSAVDIVFLSRLSVSAICVRFDGEMMLQYIHCGKQV